MLYSVSVDYAEKERYADDTFGHGTHVTGILAARINNGKGIAGLIGDAPIDILPIKVLDRYGVGGDFEIAKGVKYALDHGASIFLGLSSRFLGMNGHLFVNGKLVHSFIVDEEVMSFRLFDIAKQQGDVAVVITDEEKRVISFDVRLVPIRPTTFSDVKETYWAYDVIMQA